MAVHETAAIGFNMAHVAGVFGVIVWAFMLYKMRNPGGAATLTCKRELLTSDLTGEARGSHPPTAPTAHAAHAPHTRTHARTCAHALSVLQH